MEEYANLQAQRQYSIKPERLQTLSKINEDNENSGSFPSMEMGNEEQK